MAAKGERYPGPLVFGLDIGTRSVVGTVGYMFNKNFHVVAIQSKLHESRSMLDGQIHDIAAVSDTIADVRAELQRKIGIPLNDVCIAAAGRVLRTITVHVEQEFEESRDISPEDIYSLELLGAQRAYDEFLKKNTLNMRFYRVGYTVERYYLNKYPMTDLLAHRGDEIGADVIATFLPDEVVDGLYKAVNMAGLEVADLTLEPIAAMEVAIPKSYRMLNLALVDIGAGTSDISITRDGTIVAYGMIPSAGDELTEVIAKEYLTDFDEAEHIKFGILEGKPIEFTDIMGIKQKTTPEEAEEKLTPTVKTITREISDQIKRLNGGKPVSAIFLVGGGGKVPVFAKCLAEEMGIASERVAVRGEEVLKDIDFKDTRIKKDSLLVTPIGICLNYYSQNNNFIIVGFNDTRVKLYDNSHLQLVDAAMAAGFSNADLFPKRGQEVAYTINGKQRVVRGALGEGAEVTLNGETVPINAKIKAGDNIRVVPSTAGAPAAVPINSLPEYTDSIRIYVNDKQVTMPKFAEVNGVLQSGYYEIQNGDEVVMRDYYTVAQVLEFLDVTKESDSEIFVNHEEAYSEMPVYENFSVEIEIHQEELLPDPEEVAKKEAEQAKIEEEVERLKKEALLRMAGLQNPKKEEAPWKTAEADIKKDEKPAQEAEAETKEDKEETKEEISEKTPEVKEEKASEEKPEKNGQVSEEKPAETEEKPESKASEKEESGSGSQLKKMPDGTVEMTVRVNGSNVVMKGKKDYIYVDVFERIDFDLSVPKGKMVVTKLNGMRANYAEKLRPGDILEIYWTN